MTSIFKSIRTSIDSSISTTIESDVDPIPSVLSPDHPNMLGMWLDNNSGVTRVDESPAANNGTIEGSPILVPFGGSDLMEFNGDPDAVRYLPNKFRTTTGAVSAWVVMDSTKPGISNYVLSMSNKLNNAIYMLIGVRSDRTILVQTGTSVGPNTTDIITGTTVMSADALHHCVWQPNAAGTAWEMYLDGSLETINEALGSNHGAWWGDTDLSTTNDMTTAVLRRSTDGFVEHVSGVMRAYDRRLTTGEITTLANGGTPI